MKNLLYIALILLGFAACDDQKPGFLITEYAQYNPDSLVIEKEILDQNRIDFNIPWVTLKMEGIEGTNPITITIESVKSETEFDLDQFLKDVTVRGNGIFEIALDHTIPTGRYLISLRATNEGYTSVMPNIFTIIIE